MLNLRSPRSRALAVATVVLVSASVAVAGTAVSGASEPAAPSPAAAPGETAPAERPAFRNTASDGWPYADTPAAQIPFDAYLGPREEYLNGRGDEVRFPTPSGGHFRIECEYSHLAYADPLKLPGVEGGSHLHTFFGNTDVDAATTPESLRDSGSSTCNGYTRSSYWVPTLFDGDGNVRIPTLLRVYYKGFNTSLGKLEPYDEGLSLFSDNSTNDALDGGYSFRCQSSYFEEFTQLGPTMPDCTGTTRANGGTTVLEMNVKFGNCYDGDARDYEDNVVDPVSNWYWVDCPASHPRPLPNLEYFVLYDVADGESTADWYLASDVDPMTFEVRDAGDSAHGDWMNGWAPDVNRAWIDGCANVPGADCTSGYLTDHTDTGGPALKRRAEYTGPTRIPAADVFEQLCRTGRTAATPAEAAYCDPSALMASMGHG